MKYAYIGNVKFSYDILKYLIEKGFKPCLVITQKNKGINADYFDLEPLCVSNEIEIIKVDEINTIDIMKKLKNLDLDYIFCFGWSKLLKKEILESAKFGVIGYHPAALPKNRGRHPIIWALFLGLKETASTFFFMDEGADTGDILSQEIVSINYEDTALTLYNKLSNTSLRQVDNFLHDLQIRKYNRSPQDKTNGNSWRKRLKIDGQIDWRMTSEAIYNLVRALTRPYVGAHFVYQEMEIKVWRAKVVNDQYKDISNLEPGKILNIDVSKNTFDVKTYDGVIRILEHDLGSVESLGDYLI